MTRAEIAEFDDQLDDQQNALACARQRGSADPETVNGWAATLRLARRLFQGLRESVEACEAYQTSQEILAERLRLMEEREAEPDTEEPWIIREAPTEVTFYTDGACAGQHRKLSKRRMGVGIVRMVDGRTDEWSLPFGAGNNQVAELLAVREALLRVECRRDSNVFIYLDSAYAIGVLAKGWRAKVNQELIAEIKKLMRDCRSCWLEKVKGHSGNPMNDRADTLASAATEVNPEQPFTIG